jgi:hypothetical protein
VRYFCQLHLSAATGSECRARERLLNEYSGRGPKDIARIVAEAREGSPIEPVPEVVPRDVQFTSIAAHGRMGAPVTLVRAEITVDGGPPPDGRSVRYFRVTRKFMDGSWMGWARKGSSIWHIASPHGLQHRFQHRMSSITETHPVTPTVIENTEVRPYT